MADSSLLEPDAAEQLISYTSAKSVDDRLAFVRQPLHTAVARYVMSHEPIEEVRIELIRSNLGSVALLSLAIQRSDTAVTRLMAHESIDAAVREAIFNFVPDRKSTRDVQDSYKLGFVSLKRAVVEEHKADSAFIASAVLHGDEVVRVAATKYVDRETAIDVMRDDKATWEQRRIVIQRFADDPEVIEEVIGIGRRSNLDAFQSETTALATHTNDRGALKRLARCGRAADAVASRFAGDPEMSSWLVTSRLGLGALVHSFSDQGVHQLKKIFIEEAQLLSQRRTDDLGLALALRLPEDVSIAKTIAGHCGPSPVGVMARATKSEEVLLALVSSPTLRRDERLRDAVYWAGIDFPAVCEAFEDLRLSELERRGVPTARSLKKGAGLEVVIAGLQSSDADVSAASRALLREMSIEHRASNQPAPSQGLEA